MNEKITTPLHDKLDQVLEIKEISKDRNANDYLNAGWLLLNIYTIDNGFPEYRNEEQIFVFGRTKDSKDPYEHIDDNSIF